MAPMLQAALVAAAENGEHHTELPVSPWFFGFGALGMFFVLLAITWTFRNVAHKH
jgi:hypothetical protein